MIQATCRKCVTGCPVPELLSGPYGAAQLMAKKKIWSLQASPCRTHADVPIPRCRVLSGVERGDSLITLMQFEANTSPI